MEAPLADGAAGLEGCSGKHRSVQSNLAYEQQRGGSRGGELPSSWAGLLEECVSSAAQRRGKALSPLSAHVCRRHLGNSHQAS